MREDIIKKAFGIIRGIEQITDYHPWDDYYQSLYQQLASLDEEKLEEAFMQIATIATETINATMEDVKKIERNIFVEKEEKERLEEVKEVVGLLSF